MSTLIYLKKSNYQLGVISNGLTIKQWEKLIRLGLYHFFDDVVTSQEAESEKPESKIFKLALDRMGCHASKSVMVGNKFSEDIMGAINAGMSAILVNSKLTETEKEQIKREGLDVEVVSDISQVKNIL
jgi:putative hydrolase of the HAD superfamily